MKKTVTISTEYIRLDALLKLSGMTMTGGEAKSVIQTGKVTVDGDVCLMRGKKIRPGQTVVYRGETIIVEGDAT
ncbi:MAG: RNA-binding S4 domain-containing protein [Clostridia bacterium]|nr:RNA-binding S4 domain-containing protein [Clostridia bacterium]